jgi:hypothetical protein
MENQEFKKPTAVYMYEDEKSRVKSLSKMKRKKISVLFWELMEKELKKNNL